MKTIARVSVVCIAISIAAVAVAAKIETKQLLGKWTGDLIIKMGDDAEKQPAVMTFKKDGTVDIKVGPMEYRASYKIQKNGILFEPDSDKLPTMTLTGVKLTDVILRGVFRPASDKNALPDGVTIELSLSRTASKPKSE